jgi:mRNA-degrading endonuclease RelE of RelBE toxin-antitoxin system
MKSLTTRQFRDAYRKLPEPVRRQARRAYRLFLQNPAQPGLNFKKIDDQDGLYSVRVGLGYRALGK